MHMEIQDNSMESVLSYLYVSPEDQTQGSLQVPLPTDLLVTCVCSCVCGIKRTSGKLILFHYVDPATRARVGRLSNKHLRSLTHLAGP